MKMSTYLASARLYRRVMIADAVFNVWVFIYLSGAS